MQIIATVTGILVLATVAEALVEHLFSPIIKARAADEMAPEPTGLDWRAITLRYTSAFIGVALCLVYRADLLLFFDLVPPWPWIGHLVTGLLIGRGANFVHDFTSTWLTKN